MEVPLNASHSSSQAITLMRRQLKFSKKGGHEASWIVANEWPTLNARCFVCASVVGVENRHCRRKRAHTLAFLFRSNRSTPHRITSLRFVSCMITNDDDDIAALLDHFRHTQTNNLHEWARAQSWHWTSPTKHNPTLNNKILELQ